MLKVGKPAIWHTKDVDIPVIIDSFAGDYGGVTYYFVAAPDDEDVRVTGVPEHELSQKMTLLEELKEKLTKMFEDLP